MKDAGYGFPPAVVAVLLRRARPLPLQGIDDREKHDRPDEHARGVERLRIHLGERVLDDGVVGAPDQGHHEKKGVERAETARQVVSSSQFPAPSFLPCWKPETGSWKLEAGNCPMASARTAGGRTGS